MFIKLNSSIPLPAALPIMLSDKKLESISGNRVKISILKFGLHYLHPFAADINLFDKLGYCGYKNPAAFIG
jgi:hypothetical protein